MINDWDIQVNVSDILGAEPVHFSWTTEKKHRKPPAERKHQESPEEPDNATLQTVEFPSPAGSTEPVSLLLIYQLQVPRVYFHLVMLKLKWSLPKLTKLNLILS